MANFKKGKGIIYCLVIFVLTLTTYACSTPLIKEEDFSAKEWKQDPKGCKNERKALFKKLEAQKALLIGETENSIRKFLGKPDEMSLSKRHQKFYVYYITEGSQCTPEKTLNGEKVMLRFNSLNQLNEVSWHQAKSN